MIEQGEQITRNDIKQNNLIRVLNQMRSSGALSAQEISAQLGLSQPTVTKNLNELKKLGLLSPGDLKKNTGGRNSRLYEILSNVHVAVGINITRHHISAVVINLKGEVIARTRIRQVFRRNEEYYRIIGDLVETVIRDSGVSDGQILGVALVIPALIARDGQSTYYNGVLGEEPVMSCSEFSRYLPYPTRFCHDGKAASYAESWFTHEPEDFFYLMISDSIIGTPILSGRPYFGINQRSGEIGHLRLVRNGRRCYCGKKGCMETYCSTKELSRITDGNLAAFFALLQSNDEQAVNVWNEYLHNLVIAINDVRLLFDCNIVIGGYLGEYMDPYLDQLYALAVDEDPFTDIIDYISVCKYKTEASATGGALMYLDEYVQSII